jgi:histidinol-phosphate aminotransferase
MKKVSKDLSKFVSSAILSRKAYVPGFQPPSLKGLIKLNTNENPFPPSPTVSETVLNVITHLNLYPDPHSRDLRNLIANKHNLSGNQVIVGNGSDDLLNLCVRTFADSERPLGMLEPSYSLYPILSSLQGSRLEKVNFKDDQFLLPVDEVIASKVNLFFLTNPHAPSGRSFDQNEILRIANQINAILVIDEAYADFATYNSIPLLKQAKNIVITRTLSKSYSLAGARVGYALAHPEVIDLLDGVREVYNLDKMAQVAAHAALTDNIYFEACRQKVLAERDRANLFFSKLGWRTIESQANFIFTEPIDSKGNSSKEVAFALFEFLQNKNIHVRHFSNHRLTDSKIRISIGTSEHMDILYESINEWKR